MKKIIFTILALTFITTSFTSCREESEKEKVIQEMKDEGAEIKVKDDKIKMETEDKKVKITDDEIKIKEED
ncbi:hypothetical protein [Olleya sp. YS]|uniref:hypothetical protein n=1 Tax=Olleya sp. YS TaxID=3028318 RepID=UPI002434133D|nr:hypothetical protein [Olleya sp. YS]WGD35636.1 hypothetical protein Ollyesu_04315 [Olleya sp. YS]